MGIACYYHVSDCKGVEGLKTVVYAGTENLYDAMRVSLNSLLYNNNIDRVYFLTEHDKFPLELPHIVKNINVKNQTYFTPSGANYNTRWKYMSLMRIALPKILAEDKVLWLDCDTIVDGDISELFEIDIENNYFAGVKEPDKSKWRIYVNAGVLFMNLAQIRKDNLDDKMIDKLNRIPYPLPDQDAINEFAQGRIVPISGMYNVSPYTEPSDVKKIYHFAANAYFRNQPLYKKYDWRLTYA